MQIHGSAVNYYEKGTDAVFIKIDPWIHDQKPINTTGSRNHL